AQGLVAELAAVVDRLADPDAAFVVHVHGCGVDAQGFRGPQLYFEPFGNLESGQRLGGFNLGGQRGREEPGEGQQGQPQPGFHGVRCLQVRELGQDLVTKVSITGPADAARGKPKARPGWVEPGESAKASPRAPSAWTSRGRGL